MATNNFLNFCPTDTGTNLLTQSEYAASADRTSGNKPGVASSKLNNKAIRQSSVISSQIAQYIADKLGADMIDDGTTATILALMKAAFQPVQPVIQTFGSGTGTFNKTYAFTITSGNATAGATYTHNSVTYTVAQTVAAGTLLYARGSAAPLASGTLTKASGSGDSTITFQAFKAPLYLRVRLVGGGGGGAGSSTLAGAAGGAGGTGGTTTFGSSLLTGTGGTGGQPTGSTAGTVGSGTINLPAYGTTVGGGFGSLPALTQNDVYVNSGSGGAGGIFGGGAGGSTPTAVGQNGISNTGGGGSGAGSSSAGGNGQRAGGSGCGGGAVDAIIPNPSATYAYAVGAGGTPGTSGTSGQNGGQGGIGYIEVTEHYQ